MPIILCADSGFTDQKAYDYFEQELDIHYIVTGKMYKDIKGFIKEMPCEDFEEFSMNKAIWKFTEFGNKLKSLTKFRRCIFTKLQRDEQGQFILDFGKFDNLIYTNIGLCQGADQCLKAARGEAYFTAEGIIRASHERGADELIHRSLK